MYIALKEANETIYWLKLMRATNIIDENTFKTLNADIYEVERILDSITKSTRKSLAKPK